MNDTGARNMTAYGRMPVRIDKRINPQLPCAPNQEDFP
jgi:hypothetical protein